MEPFSASELSFLRSVPPFAIDYKTLIDKFFENDPHDGRGLVRDIVKAYADPEFITRCDADNKLPWEDDEFAVVERRYGDFPPASAFKLYWNVIEMLENEKMIKLFRELQEKKEVKISELQEAEFEKEKIEIAKIFLLPRPKGKNTEEQ